MKRQHRTPRGVLRIGAARARGIDDRDAAAPDRCRDAALDPDDVSDLDDVSLDDDESDEDHDVKVAKMADAEMASVRPNVRAWMALKSIP